MEKNMKKILILIVVISCYSSFAIDLSKIGKKIEDLVIDKIDKKIDPATVSWECFTYPRNGFGPYKGTGKSEISAKASAITKCGVFCNERRKNYKIECAKSK